MQARTESRASFGAFRSKRARYASRACKECQRRKVKCDGGDPCARCLGQCFTCTYGKPGQTSLDKRMYRRLLADESRPKIGASYALDNGSAGAPHATSATVPSPLRKETTARASNLALHQPPLELSADTSDFNGPTSTEYTFNAVNGKLRAMGMQSVIPDRNLGSNLPSTSSGRLAQYGPFMKLLTMDPLWDMTRHDACLLIDDWCEGLGSIYPIVGRQMLLDTTSKIFDALGQARRGGLRDTGGSVAEALFDHDTNKLKLVLAIGMTKEAGGREHQAQRLFQSTSEAVEGLIWNPEGLQGIQLLFLVAMYHYHLNEEVRTGRCIAFAARLCLETGLHRRSTLDKIFRATTQYNDALQAFWAVYMLERRLSLGQGIPFSIQDSYIDRAIYAIDLANPLLVSLLQWTRLAGKTWHALNNQVEKSYEARFDEITYLDYEISKWFDELPEDYRLRDSALWILHPPTYYHSVFFVRKSHLQNLIYRPILQLSVRADQHEPTLLKAIEISRNTVRTLFHLNEQTPLIRTHPMFFQQLLLTAFGNLLLAVVSTGPGIRNSTRAEFDMFLQLFHLLSTECAALRQTWHRLQGLRDLHTKLGHSERSTHTPRSPHLTITSHQDKATTLSFDDIFPDIDLLSTLAMPLNQIDESSTQTEEQTIDLSHEAFLDLGNLFEFPFLGYGTQL